MLFPRWQNAGGPLAAIANLPTMAVVHWGFCSLVLWLFCHIWYFTIAKIPYGEIPADHWRTYEQNADRPPAYCYLIVFVSSVYLFKGVDRPNYGWKNSLLSLHAVFKMLICIQILFSDCYQVWVVIWLMFISGIPWSLLLRNASPHMEQNQSPPSSR